MPDENLDVSGNVTLAVEIIVFLLHHYETGNISFELLQALINDIFPVIVDKFGAASCYHSDELQRTHQVLTGCQWSLGCELLVY